MSSYNMIPIFLFVAITAFLLFWSFFNRARMRNSGFGIESFGTFTKEAQRKVSARIVKLPRWSLGWDEGIIRDIPFTLIEVEHEANISQQLEFSKGKFLPSNGHTFEGISDSMKHFNTANLKNISGTIRLEPKLIRLFEEGDLLDPAYMRKAGNALVELAEQAELTYPAEKQPIA
ncbi:MAG TPA: hypothetical protein DEU64_02240 [Dehalococcoidia bacterium]|nr:hypothetical protein [Dehalococcoidia bacterium]